MARHASRQLKFYDVGFEQWLMGVMCGLWFLMLMSMEIKCISASSPAQEFDVREHLSSSTRYDIAVRLLEKTKYFLTEVTPPEACTPIHLNLVARHGTRAPTKKRIMEFAKLEIRLKALIGSFGNAPNWLREWRSDWEAKFRGGELTTQGELEMYSLAERLKNRFPEVFKESYHPDVYPIAATQVRRASASAVAFGMGLFAGNGSLGLGQHRAFAVITDSPANDIHLRFHDCCHNYKESKATRKPAVEKFQEAVYLEVSSSLLNRMGVNFTSADISSLWFLCKQEASISDIVDQACGLFTPEEVELLEWADDVELYQLKGYGEAINYRMGIPLLHNVLHSMEHAIQGSEGATNSKYVERARLRFAHAETVVPFICLLGLFREGADVEMVQEEKPGLLPPRPPSPRLWRGSLVAPFGANTMLLLYKCSSKVQQRINPETEQTLEGSAYLVQVLHNEKSVPMLACNGSHLCPFEVFRDAVVAPHVKHSFEGLCSIKSLPVKHSWLQWAWEIARGFYYHADTPIELHDSQHRELR